MNVTGSAICLEELCGWTGPAVADIKAAFVSCPACGSPAGFMYRSPNIKTGDRHA